MLTIILFFVIAKFLYKKSLAWSCIVAVIGIAIVFLFPLGGYNEAELIQQTDIIPIAEVTKRENAKYVLASNQGVYVYRRIDSTTSEKGELESIKGHNTSIKVEALKDGENPVMYKYVRKAKCGWFSFAFWASKTEYVFYVPMNSSMAQ